MRYKLLYFESEISGQKNKFYQNNNFMNYAAYFASL